MSGSPVTKGIILAGGSGKRLYPITRVMTKQLLPIYDKPMIYYPLSTLMSAGIRDILIICTEHDIQHFHELLGDGSDYGCKFQYKIQMEPRGIAEAFIIGEEFIDKKHVCLILGDNVFHRIDNTLSSIASGCDGAYMFGYEVKNPERYGNITCDDKGKVTKLVEKPKNPKSNMASVGLYIFDENVSEYAKTLKPSKRGEIEIIDLQNMYLAAGKLGVKFLKNAVWMDTGDFDSFCDATNFVRRVLKYEHKMIGCIEEIAYKMGFIDRVKLLELADRHMNAYGEYLKRIPV